MKYWLNVTWRLVAVAALCGWIAFRMHQTWHQGPGAFAWFVGCSVFGWFLFDAWQARP